MNITMKEVTMKTEHPIYSIRLCHERAHLMADDLLRDYFDGGVNPKDQSDWWKLAHEFRKAETRTEIILDAMNQMKAAIDELEAALEQLAKSAMQTEVAPITDEEIVAAVLVGKRVKGA